MPCSVHSINSFMSFTSISKTRSFRLTNPTKLNFSGVVLQDLICITFLLFNKICRFYWCSRYATNEWPILSRLTLESYVNYQHHTTL